VAGSLFGHTLAIGAAVGLVMGTLAAAVALFASPSPALLHLALGLVSLMAVGLLCTSVRAFYVGLLNARGLFHAHPVASGLGMGLTLLLTYLGKEALGVRVIPLAMLSGELVAISILSALARRALALRLRPTLARPEPVRRIFALVRLEVTGSLITRINPVIDQLMSGMAGVVGGGTLLRYATDVASLPTSILQATLLPVLLTRLAQQASRPSLLRATTRRTLFTVALLLLAASALLIVLRMPLCRLLFLHGAMDLAGVARIASVLPWALAGVAPFGALLVLARAHVAQQNSRIMPSMGILNSVCNLVLNVALVGPMGLAGIALSTSLTYVVVAVVFWVRLPSRSSHGQA
jgi:putative peptidoglycan lipid II flippase